MSWWSEFKQHYLVKFWSPIPAVIALGILSTYYFGLLGTFWAVTGEFTRWGGHLAQLFGANPAEWTYLKILGFQGTPWDRIDGMMIIGMFAGALAAALWADNVKLRLPSTRIRIFQALLGGIIAGFGARLAMGCNLAAFFTGIPQFSLHAWFFAIATAIGCFAGAKVSMLPLFRIPLKMKKVCEATPLEKDKQSAKIKFIIGSVLFFAIAITAVTRSFDAPKLGMAMLFGLGFGICIERAQVCFTSAFRDMWITGRGLLAKAIIIGMAVSAIGVFAFVQTGMEPKIMWAGPNAIIGGLMFGFGIVIAGGCETGWMYRAMEGQIHFWWVGIGNVLGSLLLALCWDSLAPSLVYGYDKINMLKLFGTYGGLYVNYALMAVSFAFVVWWERRFLAKKSQYQNNHI